MYKKKLLLPLIAIVVLAVYFMVVRSQAWYERTHRKMPSAQQLAKTFPAGAQQTLEEAPQLTLMSLDPGSGVGGGLQGPGTFHGYRIMGRLKLEGERKRVLVRMLYDSMARVDDEAACFTPRHAIQATHGGRSVNLVICFSCGPMKVYVGANHSSGGVDRGAKSYFDGVLRNAGIALAPR